MIALVIKAQLFGITSVFQDLTSTSTKYIRNVSCYLSIELLLDRTLEEDSHSKHLSDEKMHS